MNATPRMGFMDWLSFGASFVLVLGLLLGVLHLLRRLRNAPGRTATRRPLQVLDAQSLAPRQRVMLIRAHDRQLLLGLSPGQVSLIASWSAQEIAALEAADRSGANDIDPAEAVGGTTTDPRPTDARPAAAPGPLGGSNLDAALRQLRQQGRRR
jgi:flagellar biosynthetic protein FliO